MRGTGLALGLVALLLLGCSRDHSGKDRNNVPEAGAPASAWQQVFADLPGALVSVWGSTSEDVWVVGSAPPQSGAPTILHYQDKEWQRFKVNLTGDLWWVHGWESGPVLMGGSNGVVLRSADGVAFERMLTPPETGTVFGLWGSSPDDVWAVGGGLMGRGTAFIWRYQGGEWRVVSVPELAGVKTLFKVWGTSAADVWVVGGDGAILHFDGASWVRLVTSLPDPIFTVHTRASGTPRAVAVGGFDLGVLFELNAEVETGAAPVPQALPAGTGFLFGVWLTEQSGYTVGRGATVFQRLDAAWQKVETGLETDKDLHAVWVDSARGVWAVGGDVQVPPLSSGVLVHYGAPVGTAIVDANATLIEPDASFPVVIPEAGPSAPDVATKDAQADVAIDATVDSAPDVVVQQPVDHVAGSVACGATQCNVATHKCCFSPSEVGPAYCEASATACAVGFRALGCDETADCTGSDLCCIERAGQGGGVVDVVCLAGCFPWDQLCAATTECGDAGPCVLSSELSGYEVCE